jgi:hypothetical protein
MLRISDVGVKCPICDHPDYCLVSDDGLACICTRISGGSVKQCGNAGYLHILKKGEFKGKKFTPKEPPNINWFNLMKMYEDKLRKSLEVLDIGLRQGTLEQFCMGWDGKAFTFPMRDETTRPIGMQVRFKDGKKMTVKGSQAGLFMPNLLVIEDLLAITEGVSDAATLTEMGVPTIGRFNCNSGGDMIVNYCKWLPRCPKIVLVGDNDGAGKDGLDALGTKLTAKGIDHVKVYPTQFNDVREAYVTKGLTKEDFYQIVKAKGEHVS